jgi:ankyrin repeat protein
MARGCGNIELIRILLETGANVNAPPAEGDDRTSLQAASECGKIELVKILLRPVQMSTLHQPRLAW